jgi:hypothetical protein
VIPSVGQPVEKLPVCRFRVHSRPQEASFHGEKLLKSARWD